MLRNMGGKKNKRWEAKVGSSVVVVLKKNGRNVKNVEGKRAYVILGAS